MVSMTFRSDHVPFWDKGYGAVQWTDTAYYRNPNYHAATDTPDTLDYGFLASVTNLIAVAGAEFWFRMVTMRDDDSTSKRNAESFH
jgi:hypothetical protein